MRRTEILAFEDGLAKNQTLWSLVEEYLIGRGKQITQADLGKLNRVWAETVELPDGTKKCTGLMAITQTWVVPFFDCEDDRSRGRMVNRILTVLEEHAGGPTGALINVDPASEDRWTNLLLDHNGEKLNLWKFETGPKVVEAIEAT